MYGLKTGKILTYTGTAVATSVDLSVGRSGACMVKIKTANSLTISFDGGKSSFTQASADNWQDYIGYIPSVKISGAGVYTVLITTVG